MPRIPGTTNQQSAFLRAFRTHPNGPPPELWPSPAIFRRWMRRPTFAKTVDSRLQAVRLQTDCHLAFAACQAARQAAQTCAAPASPDPAAQPKPPDPNQLFRLHHLRQRFPANPTSAGTNGKSQNLEPAEPEPPALTEREWVYQINGQKGLEAYDQFIADKEEYKRAQAQAQSQSQDQPSHNPDMT